MSNTNIGWFRKGMKDGIPIALGYLAVAFTLGLAAEKAGMTAFQSALMSFGLHASAGEYIAFTLIAAHATVLEMVIMEVVAKRQISFDVLCAQSEDTIRYPDVETDDYGILCHG